MKINEKTYILFDLDGTLTDSADGITNSVAHSFRRFGLEVPDKTQLYKFVGPPLKNSFMKFYGFDADDAQKALEHYWVNYRARGIYEVALYDGVKETLSVLKDMGKKLYVATSKPEVFAKQIVKNMGIDDLLDDVVGSNFDGTRVNKNEVIASVLERNQIFDKSTAVMVGDREYDILGAKKMGLASIGVLYGYGNFDELKNAGADHIVNKIGDIIDII